MKNELNLLKETKRDEKKKQIHLQQEHAALTEELAKEKVKNRLLPYLAHLFQHIDTQATTYYLLFFTGTC